MTETELRAEIEALGGENVHIEARPFDYGARYGFAVSFDACGHRRSFVVRSGRGLAPEAHADMAEWARGGFARNWSRHEIVA